MKKIISIVLSLVMLLSLLPTFGITAQAATLTSGSCGENVTYSFDSSTGTLTISGTGDMYDYNKGSDSPFYDVYDNTSIINVVITNGVTSIGDYLFYRCRCLSNISIPEGVTRIGKSAFYYCSNYINKTGITSVILPNSVEMIDDHAFHGCDLLQNVQYGNSLKYIGQFAFSWCELLTNPSFPETLEYIGYAAFNACYAITEFSIPKNVSYIGGASLTPHPESSLEKINVDKDNKYYASENGILYNKDKTELLIYPCKKSATTYNMPDSVTSIPNNVAFRDCDNLKTIKMSNGVSSLGARTFENCSSLETVSLPNGITIIGYNCFYGCEALTSITIPNSVTSIGNSAFSGCNNLNHVVIPDSVTSIGELAFAGSSADGRTESSILYKDNNYTLPVAKSILYQNKLYMCFDKPIANFNGLFSTYFQFMEAPNSNLMNIADSLQRKGPRPYYILGGQLINGNWLWQYSKAAINTDGKWGEGQPSGGGEAQFALASSDGLYHDIGISSTTPGFIAGVDLKALNSQSLKSTCYKTNKYVFYNNTVPCSAAKLICEANGGYLATVANADENAAIRSLISPTNSDAVIGGIRTGNTAGDFEWYNGDQFNYTNWNSGEPNNYSSMGGQYYTVMYSTGYWDDNCDKASGGGKTNNGFICEYRPTDIRIVVEPSQENQTLSADDIKLQATYPDGSTAFIEKKYLEATKHGKSLWDISITYENELGEENTISTAYCSDSTGKCGDNANYYFDSKTNTLSISGTGDIYDYTNSAKGHFSDFYSIVKNVVIDDGITRIGESTFSGCSQLESVTLPDTLKEIGIDAFNGCASLGEVQLPAGLESIESYALCNCSSLTDVVIPKTVKTIEFGAFLKCSSLENITVCPYYADIADNANVFPEGAVLRGCPGSAAQSYAQTHNREFAALEHQFETTTVDPKCEEQGYDESVCSVCDYKVSGNSTPASGHSYVVSETVAPTCTEQGYTVYQCENCDSTYRDDYTDPTGHTYEIAENVPASCTVAGYITYHCVACGDEYTDVIPKIPHSYTFTPVDPTCTESGYTEYVCTMCDNTYRSNYTAALGHTYGEYTFDHNATVGFDGTQTAKCIRCHSTVTKNVNPPTVYAATVSGNAGDEITVPVYIKNNTGMAAFALELNYDEDILEPVSVTNGDIISGNLNDNIGSNAFSGKFKVIWYDSENLNDNGKLFNVVFRIKDNANTGQTVLKIDYLADDTFDEDYNSVDLECNNIEISVSNTSINKWINASLYAENDNVKADENIYIGFDKVETNGISDEYETAINYDSNAFEFLGYSDKGKNLIQTSNSNGKVELVYRNGEFLDKNCTDFSVEDVKDIYLVFRAKDAVESRKYLFELNIDDAADFDDVRAEGCSVNVQRGADYSISLTDRIIAEYGDEITVPVSISNNKGIMGYMLNFEYNPQHLEIISAEKGSAFGGTFDSTIGVDEEGKFSVLWSDTDDISTDGVLMNLTFRVITNESVISPLEISYSQDDTFNGNYEDVKLNCNGTDIKLNDADKTALIAAIEKARAFSESDYSSESYNLLVSTYTEYGRLVDSFATQLQADEATTDILTAISNLVPYLFLTVKAENGTVSVNEIENSNKYSLLFGDSVTMTATADEGYVFDGWYETVTKRIRSTDETFTFKITSNTDFEARFIKEESATLSFESEDGWIAGSINKTVSEWADITSIDEMLPKVPYKLGCTNGRWVYNENTVLQKLQNGENVVITPNYDSSDYEKPEISTPLNEEPALNLYYQLDNENDVGSFVMPLGVPQDCHIESIGIALYYKKAEQFNPVDFELTINNKITTSKFEANDQSGVYTLNIRNFKDNYNWAVRGYVTYYDSEGNLKVAYSNQINIVARQQVFGNHIHSYDTVVTAPTCTDRGYTTYTCDECGYSYIDDHTQALGHSWNSGVITKVATCVSTGEKEFVCAVCGASRKESIPVDSANHKNVVTDAAISPTCTESGLSEGSHCEDCKVVITEQQTVPATGHNYSAYVTQPTCTDRGYTTYTCETCGERNVSDYQDSLGHLWSEWAENGNVKTRSCSRCGITETEEISENSVISIEVLSDEELSLYKSNSPEEYIIQLSDAISRANCSLLLTYNDGSTEVLHYDSMRDVIVGEADNEIYLNDIKLVGTSPLDISSVDVGEKLTLFGELYGCVFGAEFTIVEDPIDYIVITPELLYGGSRYLRSNEYVGNWYDFEQMFKDNNAVITVYYKDGRVEQNRVISREFEDSDGHVYYYNGFERSDIYFNNEDYSALSSGDTASGCVVVGNRYVFFEFIFE